MPSPGDGKSASSARAVVFSCECINTRGGTPKRAPRPDPEDLTRPTYFLEVAQIVSFFLPFLPQHDFSRNSKKRAHFPRRDPPCSTDKLEVLSSGAQISPRPLNPKPRRPFFEKQSVNWARSVQTLFFVIFPNNTQNVTRANDPVSKVEFFENFCYFLLFSWFLCFHVFILFFFWSRTQISPVFSPVLAHFELSGFHFLFWAVNELFSALLGQNVP